MQRWRFLLALVTILALGFPAADARKMLIIRRGGDALQGWLTLKVIDIHKEHGQSLAFSKSKAVPFFGRIPGLQHLDGPQVQGFPQSFVCDTCMDISTFAEQVLTDPDTTSNVLEYVNGSLCQVLPAFQSECVNLAEMYVPSLVETMQIYAAPNKLCGETKLCPSSAMLLLNDARACKMCTKFATEALAYAQDSKTETEVLEALHAQCAKLGDFSSRCNMLVDTYAPLYISKLDSTTPEQICEKVGICSSESIRDPSSCATCEFAVYQLKAKLRNPLVQEKMMETLINECSKVPAHVEQCKEIVTQYGPYMLANLDKYMDAETICTEIHACESKTKLASNDMLIRLPGARDSIAHQ
ncbi:hypothetical protein GOP47_0030033 [Adiantum capillus-veneris]|nr:hypothetical protein GOP47_0030033 [Adiantum capillus-veneris]